MPNKDYWIKIDESALNDTKEAIKKLNMGEKISIKKLKVIKKENKVNMILDIKSKLQLFY